MGYLSINNLYKDKMILMFKECYACEKLDGTSSSVTITSETTIHFHSGGASNVLFVSLFNKEDLIKRWKEHGYDSLTVYGEAYGGKIQKMAEIYGPNLKFCAFEVFMNDRFLDVDQAERIVKNLGLEFVDYVKIPTTLEAIDAERDKPSVQAIRNGMGDNHQREGVVLRPLIEMEHNGERVICKHKNDSFMETKTPRKVEIGADDLLVLKKAEEIANEWTTLRRLEHVLDKLPPDSANGNLKVVIDAMIVDIVKESKGEIIDSPEARKAIGRKTVEELKKWRSLNI